MIWVIIIAVLLAVITWYVLTRKERGKQAPDADEFIASAIEGANRIRSVVSDMSAYLKNNQGGGVASGAISD
jgi:hypothetical protein